MTQSKPEVWYRVEGTTYAPPIDEYENVIGSSSQVLRYNEYEVIKHTPKGVWVKNFDGLGNVIQSFVLANPHGKRLCYKERAFALYSFIARKKRAASIMRARVQEAERFVTIAERDLMKMGMLGATAKSTLDFPL